MNCWKIDVYTLDEKISGLVHCNSFNDVMGFKVPEFMKVQSIDVLRVVKIKVELVYIGEVYKNETA